MAEGESTLREHLNELRRRLIITAVATVVATVVAFVFHERILEFLLVPAEDFGMEPGTKPIFTDVTEMIGVTMKASLMGGVVLALPMVLYQVVMFVAPGLTGREKGYLYIFLPGTLLAFAGGVMFGYYILLPPALRFLFTFGSDIATPMIRIGNYMSVVTSLLFWMGIIFELPLVMFFLARLGVVSSQWLAKYRRYFLVVAFLLGAAITPTVDPVNQTLVAVPIVVLYEVGIWLAKLAERLRRRSPDLATTESGHP